jgi:hypothetical protein
VSIGQIQRIYEWLNAVQVPVCLGGNVEPLNHSSIPAAAPAMTKWVARFVDRLQVEQHAQKLLF